MKLNVSGMLVIVYRGDRSRVFHPSSHTSLLMHAFVTLLTSDSYLPGALALAGALEDVHHSDQQVVYETVCLVTPHTLNIRSIKLLRRAFNVVIGVEVIAQPDAQRLALLGECILTSRGQNVRFSASS